MEVPGIPAAVARERVLALVKSLGIDPDQVYRLEFSATSIYAEVFALGPEGHRYPDQRPGHEDQYAMHRVSIKIVEEPWPVPASPSTTATT